MYFGNYQSQPMNSGAQYGGYPMGYPPNMPQPSMQNPMGSPFPNPQPLAIGTPLEVTNRDGSTMTIPASTGFNPGGATVSQGGFNPVTGVTTPAMGSQGFNPYGAAMNMMPSQPMGQNQFIGNMGYGASPIPANPMSSPTGFGVYDPSNRQAPFVPPMGGYGVYSPFTPGMGSYGFVNPYGQNQFNYQLQNFLYNEDESSFDSIAMLEQVILTDEEREKINHKNQSYIVGQDYYGRPIYNNAMGAYNASQQRQKEFEEARRAWQNHFTMLSRIAHGYTHEKIDEAATMRRFDPVPQQQTNIPQQKIFNYNTATEKERVEYQRDMILNYTKELDRRFNEEERRQQMYNMQKQYAFAQIKASHDKMIGVEPGMHYDLKTYMDNAYKIRINMAHQAAKSVNRNGTNKYSRADFRANLSQNSNSPVPITSKDDEYVSIEEMLKGIYDRNKRVDSVLRNNNGQNLYAAIPQTPEFNSEMEAHQYFLQAMQNKKNVDDVRRAVK